MGFLGVVSCIGSILGWLVLVVGFLSAKGAPQEAAVAGLAIALAVLPYTFFRAVQLSTAAKRQAEFQAALLRRLESIENSLDKA
jgi:hypothetical protein